MSKKGGTYCLGAVCIVFMEFKPQIKLFITGTLKEMKMDERGNCVVTITTNAEREIRNVRIRFYDIAKVMLYRVRDHVKVEAHIQNHPYMADGERRFRQELIGDSINKSQRRLSTLLEQDIDTAVLRTGQQDENWGIIVGNVQSIFSPNDKATVLTVTVPRGERQQRCTISCLGRFKSIADKLKENDRIAATVYVSVRESDETHPFSQNLVCTDLFQFQNEEIQNAEEEDYE